MITLEAIRRVLAELDPEGLIRLGAPQDEYESEARALLSTIRAGRRITPEHVRDVWLVFFGTSTPLHVGDINLHPEANVRVDEMPMRDDFIRIAARINDLKGS